MKGRVAILSVAAFLAHIPSVCRAQGFSADVAYDPLKSRNASSRELRPSAGSRLYVSTDKMRLDLQA
jgi:hypothetical protein